MSPKANIARRERESETRGKGASNKRKREREREREREAEVSGERRKVLRLSSFPLFACFFFRCLHFALRTLCVELRPFHSDKTSEGKERESERKEEKPVRIVVFCHCHEARFLRSSSLRPSLLFPPARPPH